MLAPPWLEVLDETIGGCLAHHRPDLGERLRETRAQLLDPKLRVLVIGGPNQGKSQLVNALVNASLCAVGDDLTTVTPTVVQHAETPTAVLVRQIEGVPAPAGRRALPAADRPAPPPERVPVPIDEITGRSGRDPRLTATEIGLPRQLLAAGLVLVDTPAIGEGHATASVPRADAVILASAATAELTATELTLLAQIAQSCPNVIVALTKIDIAPGWRAVLERNRTLLANARVPARLIPVSAELRLRAARTGDKNLNAESGFPDLISCLQRDTAAKSDRLAGQTVATQACAALAELVMRLREDLTTQHTDAEPDPESTEIQRRVDALRRRTARWQTVLADEMAELTADVEYDLRDRTRQILREVDRAFDTADPARAWEEFVDWLDGQLTEAAETNYAWLIDRCRWVAGKVARNFPPHRDGTPPETLVPDDDVAERIGELEKPRLERFTVSQKVFTALRGSYGGVLMFGLMTSLAGLPLINPVSVAAGAALGGKSIKDEGDVRLRQRQSAAKAAAQRYVDDFFLQFSKECKDTLRTVQRQLRDHFSAMAEQLQDDLMAAARAARDAARADALDRARRQRQANEELTRLAALHKRAQALALAHAALPEAQARRGITA